MNSILTRIRIFQSKKFSLKEQTFFAKRLSFLITAGVPLSESIETLVGQTHARGHVDILQAIHKDVLAGQTLSKSFAKFPKIFNEFSVQIIKVGESTGTLSQNLVYLADELKKRQALRSKVISACIYPALITAATFGITLFLTMYLFPKIMPVFNSLNVQLPLSTRIMIGVSTFMTHWGIYLVLVCGALVAFSSWLLTRYVVLTWYAHKIVLRLPLFGKMLRFYNNANACRTLGLLLQSGLPLSEALDVTAETMSNLVYKGEFLKLAKIVRRGEKMSSYILQHTRLFPEMMGHMIAVGEKSGTLPETLVYVSGMYDSEVEEFTKNIATLIEPALMLVMGLMVGFIAVSIITPIYGITQNLHA